MEGRQITPRGGWEKAKWFVLYVAFFGWFVKVCVVQQTPALLWCLQIYSWWWSGRPVKLWRSCGGSSLLGFSAVYIMPHGSAWLVWKCILLTCCCCLWPVWSFSCCTAFDPVEWKVHPVCWSQYVIAPSASAKDACMQSVQQALDAAGSAASLWQI